MNRRHSVQTLMAASGSLVALPAWAQGWHSDDINKHVSTFSAETRETLAAVADTIIPQGNSLGALSVEVDKFLQKLFDDCYETDIQENVRVQLEALEVSAQRVHQKSFKDCEPVQREEMLTALSGSEDLREAEFFKLIKAETIRGFTTSREVMLNYYKFKQIPGHYQGCVDVNA